MPNANNKGPTNNYDWTFFQVTEYRSDRMTKVLGITPYTLKQSLIDMAYSMIESGKIKKTSSYKGPAARDTHK